MHADICNPHLCFGFISDIDPAKGLVRVEFAEDDDVPDSESDAKTLVSDWLPVSVKKSLNDKETFPYDVNEHVWCIMDEHCEYGIVGGCLYNTEDVPDGEAGADVFKMLFKDGSFDKLDRSSGDWKRSSSAGAFHEIKDKHTITAGTENLRTLLKDMNAAMKAMTFTNTGGVTDVTNNLAVFDTFDTRIDTLLG